MTPWTAPSVNSHLLCLLDTNALSEIVKNPKREGRGFLERFGPTTHAPCFTFYNLVEIRRDPTVFSKFVDFFSVYPCFLLKMIEDVVQLEDALAADEPGAVLFNAFSAVGRDDSYDIRGWIDTVFSDSSIWSFEQGWRQRELATLEAWITNKATFDPKRPVPNAADAASFVKGAMPMAVAAFVPDWEPRVTAGEFPNPDRYLMLQAMLYSQYYRIYDPTWDPRPQEVTDVQIAAYAPYVDAFVTERFQAEICRKMKRANSAFRTLHIGTLADLRAASP